MAHIDDLMAATSTKFHLSMLAAKRAREINNYYQQLGEGSRQFVSPLVSTDSNKPLSIALEEIAQGKVVEAEASEVVTDDPLAFIGEEELVLDDLEAGVPDLQVVPDPEPTTDEAPTDEAAVDEASADEASADEAPVDEASADEAPVDE